MIRNTLFAALAALLLLPTGTPASAAVVDYFLKLDGVPGESQDLKHRNEIDVLSFSQQWSQRGSAASGAGAASGKPEIGPLLITKRLDVSSPRLMLLCASGQHVKQAQLFARKAGGKAPQEFLTCTLQDLLVTSYRVTSTGDAGPIEEVALSFGAIEWEYRQMRPDGSMAPGVKAGWDLSQNKQRTADIEIPKSVEPFDPKR